MLMDWSPKLTHNHSRSPMFPSRVAGPVPLALADHTLLAMTSTDVVHPLVASAHAGTRTVMATAREAPAETTTTIALDSDRHLAAGLPTTTHLRVAATTTRTAATTLLPTPISTVVVAHHTIVLLLETCLLVMHPTPVMEVTHPASTIDATGNLLSCPCKTWGRFLISLDVHDQRGEIS